KIIKQRFLNYRLFSLKVVSKKDGVLDAHALIYSTLARKKVQGNRVKDEVNLITLKRFNTLNNSNYQSIKELIFNPPTVEKELDLRAKISDNNYDLTPVIILDAVPESKLTIYLDAITYEDTKEKLIVL
ncbi:MAG: diacylglucosamine hydrolase like protein, partial [Epsilonproteobacteria bacterium]|nr:diacylglucosamine hydrolase like protein [Campylobacterota bacterium]